MKISNESLEFEQEICLKWKYPMHLMNLSLGFVPFPLPNWTVFACIFISILFSDAENPAQNMIYGKMQHFLATRRIEPLNLC